VTGLLPWILTAMALPTRVAVELEAGTQASDVEVSTDGTVVAVGDESSGAVWLLDVGTWTVVDATPCTNPAGVAADPTTDARFWVGCADGTITWVSLSDGTVSQKSERVEIAETAVMGMTADDTMVYVLVEDEAEGNPQLHSYDPATEAVNGSANFPSYVGATGFEDIAIAGTAVYVTHGGTNITRVDVSSGGATLQFEAPGGISTGDILVVGGASVLVTGGDAGVLIYETGANRLVLLLGSTSGVEEASALGAETSEGYVLVADGDQHAFLRFDSSTSTGLPTGTVANQLGYPDTTADVTEIGTTDGYAFAGVASGGLWVLTDRPWVEAEDAAPAAALDGEEVSVAFTADTDGEWTARLNADSNTDGTELDSGSIKAGKTRTAKFTVGSGFKEGDNRIRIVVRDAAGKSGHDTSTVNVDNPPSKVSLRDKDTGFGDRMITVGINGIDDEDLSHYMVYVSTEVFEPSDYATGGPVFVGAEGDSSATKVNVPRKVRANPGVDKELTISPLTNGVTYYVAVRATDEAGQEGPMSNVASAMPRKTYGAADLAGEKGGFSCATVSGTAMGWLGVLGALLVGLRRSVVVAPALLLWVSAPALLLCVSAPAQAASEWPQSGKTLDEIKGGAFEFRYGPMFIEDENIKKVFGETGNNILWLEMGPTIFDLLEVTGNLGYFHRSGNLVSAGGAQSSQEDKLTAYAFALDFTARLDVVPEQPIVPFIGVGMDYWLWREKWETNPDVGGEEKVGGGKSGWHYSMGGHVLLDAFHQKRAGRLEAVTGITDSYITVEYRVQRVGESVDGLKFSANTVTAGLKLDY
jgi:hypothetical protein